jgi:hypothetical protein
MASETLEVRLTLVEDELAQIKRQLAAEKTPIVAGWESIFGSFADSAGFEEAVRLGRQYRDAQVPEDDENGE